MNWVGYTEIRQITGTNTCYAGYLLSFKRHTIRKTYVYQIDYIHCFEIEVNCFLLYREMYMQMRYTESEELKTILFGESK